LAGDSTAGKSKRTGLLGPRIEIKIFDGMGMDKSTTAWGVVHAGVWENHSEPGNTKKLPRGKSECAGPQNSEVTNFK
jgi:hypothetical protein